MRSRWLPFALVVVLAIGAVVWAGSNAHSPPPRRRSARDEADATTAWSTPVIAHVAHDVSTLRQLEFTHPVPVTFVDRAGLNRAYVRASGGQATHEQAAAVAGFYDPRRHRVWVLGEEGDVVSRILLSHELTHVLQDQNFDSEELSRVLTQQRSWGVLSALQEGDAMLVLEEYEEQLDAREPLRRFVSMGSVSASGSATIAETLRLGDYIVAPSALRAYRASGATGGSTDNLFRHPPRSDAPFLTPSKFFAPKVTHSLPEPVLEPGDTRVGSPYYVSPLQTYLVLGRYLDAEDALRIADGWNNGGAVDFRRQGRTCTRFEWVGDSAAADTAFADGLSRWVSDGGRGDTVATDTSSRFGTITSLTACGTNVRSDSLLRRPAHLLMVAATRNHVEAQLVGDVGAPVAECAANAVMDEPLFDRLVEQAESAPTRVPALLDQRTTRRRLTDLAQGCEHAA